MLHGPVLLQAGVINDSVDVVVTGEREVVRTACRVSDDGDEPVPDELTRSSVIEAPDLLASQDLCAIKNKWLQLLQGDLQILESADVLSQ